MLKWFRIHKNENEFDLIDVKEALEGKVQTPYPLSYLKLISDERAWDGKPHVTDLLNGPRMLYLKQRVDYAIDPDEAAFRVFGVNAHSNLETYGDNAEIAVENDEVIGRSDILEENPDKTYTMTDYKAVGSFKVALGLGIVGVDEPTLDDNGNPIYYKSGEKAGKMRTHKVYKMLPEEADTRDWTRQLNIYRRLAQKQLGIVISKLQIFAIVRDGNTIAARSRGVMKGTYLIPIRIFADDVVDAFISKRSLELRTAMAGNEMPRICNDEESWEGRRCKGFCPVSEACMKHEEELRAAEPLSND